MRSVWFRTAALAATLASMLAVGGASPLPQWYPRSVTIVFPAPPRPLPRLRLSPDGRYVLLQDDSRVTVLSVEPFSVLFHAPAKNVTFAEFSPDSRQVLFVSSFTRVGWGKLELSPSPAHVERWSIAERRRVEFTEIHSQPCRTLKLSPDGRILACVDFVGKLTFVNVASGETIFAKKNFSHGYVNWGADEVGMYTRHESSDVGDAGIEFSPGGRFVLAAPGAVGSHFGWDSTTGKTVKLSGALRRYCYFADEFIFVDGGRVLIRPGIQRIRNGFVTWMLVAFPSGKILSKTKMPARGIMFRAADPKFVIFRSFGEFPVGAIEYGTGRVITSRTPLLDVLGTRYVAERSHGELGVYERGKPSAVATARLVP